MLNCQIFTTVQNYETIVPCNPLFRHWRAQTKSCFKHFVPIIINSGNEIARGHCQLACSDVIVCGNVQRGQLKLTLAFRPTHVIYSHLHQNLSRLCCTPFSPSHEVQKKSQKPISSIIMYLYKIILKYQTIVHFTTILQNAK